MGNIILFDNLFYLAKRIVYLNLETFKRAILLTTLIISSITPSVATE